MLHNPARLSASPYFYEKKTVSCQDKSAKRTDDFFSLNLFLFGNITMRDKNLAEILDQQLLRDPARKVISNTFYGERVKITGPLYDVTFTTLSAPVALNICPEDESFEEETIESAGLNAAYFINKTHSRYTGLGIGPALKPLTLNIMPSITQKKSEFGMNGWEESDAFWTDNAIYNPEASSITFLPHSMEWKRTQGTVNFWAIPMVPSHEYGHHIFQGIYQARTSSIHRHQGCFGSINSTQQEYAPDRKVSPFDVLGAYNEGFADLVSFYTLDAEELNFDGVSCLQVTRNVKSASFYDGQLKTFSGPVLESFFSTSKLQENRTCEQTNYQDIHFIGAIFAYSAERFMSQMTDSSDEKFKIIIEWAKLLKAKEYLYLRLEGDQYLRKTFADFLKLSARTLNRRFDQQLCQEAEKLFTGIKAEIPECNL